jgi:glutaredoxin
MVKKYLDHKNLKYEVINLDDHPERNQEAFDISGGAMTVPITIIRRDQAEPKVVVGWQIGQLAAAIA